MILYACAAPATVSKQSVPTSHCEQSWEGGTPGLLTSLRARIPALGKVQEMLREAHGWQIAVFAMFTAYIRHLLSPCISCVYNVPGGVAWNNLTGNIMKKSYLIAAFFCALSPLAHAATDINLDEIVVTATRFEQPLKQTLSSTSVITQEDIKNSQATDVATILRSVAGVEISQSGGTGKSTYLYLRGSSQSQVLVLLDGVRINSATSGTTSIEHLMLDQIERIEVVRGNVSSLYGSEAIGGVVQIFTKHGHGAPVFNASAGIGSHGTQRMAAGFGGSVDNTDLNLQVSRFMTEGVSALNPALVPTTNPDNNGYDNTSVSANVRHAFNADHSLAASVFNSQGYNQFDGYNLPTDSYSSDVRVSKFSLTSDDRLNESWQSKIQLAQGVDSQQNFKNSLPATPGSLYKTTNQQLTWQNTLQLAAGKQLLAGVEYLRQQVSSDLQPEIGRASCRERV